MSTISYEDALDELKAIIIPIIERASNQYVNNRYPFFYKNILMLTDLRHHRRNRELKPFKVIGSGAFSVVLKHPKLDGVVFKLHACDGCEEYIEYVEQNDTSPVHLKVFHREQLGVLDTELTHEGVYCAVIEELYPIKRTKENVNMQTNLKLLEENKDYEATLIPDLMLEHALTMKDLAEKTKTRLDLWHNIMRRKNNELVSIDPLVYSWL